MNFRRQRQQEDISVNLTPLIDVVFLLLIFFMVSTSFTKESYLNINLPEASSTKIPTQLQQIEITINKQGEFALNGEMVINTQLSTLMRALEKVSEGNNKLPLAITADANTPYQAVVTAMDAAGQLGFVNLSMTTRRATE